MSLNGARGFASDNSATIHPDVLAAIARVNVGHTFGYGHDDYTLSVEARVAHAFARGRERVLRVQRDRSQRGVAAGREPALRGRYLRRDRPPERRRVWGAGGDRGAEAADRRGGRRQAHARAGREPDHAGRGRARGAAARGVDLAVHGARDAVQPGGDAGAGRSRALARPAAPRRRSAAEQRGRGARGVAGGGGARRGRPVVRRHEERPARGRGGRHPEPQARA